MGKVWLLYLAPAIFLIALFCAASSLLILNKFVAPVTDDPQVKCDCTRQVNIAFLADSGNLYFILAKAKLALLSLLMIILV